jgi:hypothetical protein
MKKAFIALALCQAVAAMAAGPAAPGSASFKCGGIGDAEQRAFKEAAASHHALLTFATTSGAYVADVEVKVTAADGAVVVQGPCSGPLMLLDVPAPGKYRIDATSKGQLRTNTVTLGGKPARVGFTWPAS